jgi:predicted enzyme related to lactoylglutathione lyase
MLTPRLLLTVALAMTTALACQSSRPDTTQREAVMMRVHYLEIVTDDVDGLVALHQRLHGLTFGRPDADLGQARVATRADGTLVGVRKPLAAHEAPIVRPYVEVDDIEQAVKQAEAQGATIAYPPTRQGQRGTFAIYLHGGVQQGLWQR